MQTISFHDKKLQENERKIEDMIALKNDTDV